ncbi:hypothetical protein TNCV_4989891 [Trichonephila clavipes]|uniref:Transposase n=1 Tax=Trichonephila clavipes TaxID=2585209 RepID=A0A8X6WAR8_TRICX|nr:hypothetical protein TNCV_4989891 [Trichonephila clavipes]
MLEKVIGNWTSRLDYIQASRGSHVPDIILKILLESRIDVGEGGGRIHYLQKFQTIFSVCSLLGLRDGSGRPLYPLVASGSWEDCQVIYSQFGLAIHQNDHQARRRFIEWAQNEIAVAPEFHKRILFSDEAHFWLNGYVNKQNCRIWSEANPQVYVETPLHPEKLTVWCALWAGGILLQKR